MGEMPSDGLGKPVGMPSRGPLRRFWEWLWPFPVVVSILAALIVTEFVGSPILSFMKASLPKTLSLPISPVAAILMLLLLLSTAGKIGFWWAQRTRGVAGGQRWLFGGEVKPGRLWEFGAGCSQLIHDSGRLIPDPLASSGMAYWAERSQDARGVHTYGPYVELPRSGEYLAVFYLKVTGCPVDSARAFGQVQAYYTRRSTGGPMLLAAVSVCHTGDSYQSFALRYIVPADAIEDCLHEWRVIPMIGVSVWLDRITVERLGDLPAEAH